jgi:glycerol-3-phosphate dehydrogenase
MPHSSPRIPHPKSKVLVLGAGNFGSCLADHLGDSEHDIFMWSRQAKLVKYFNEHHRNPDYLKDHAFSENIQAVGPDLPGRDFLKSMDVLLFAIPTQALR